MPFVVCYYHAIWSTKHRKPIISQPIEPVLFDTICHKSQQLKSNIHAVNAAYDHVHVAVEISPAIAVSEWVRQVKAVSARIINREFPDSEDGFYWQKSFGMLSFGKKTLPSVVQYIENQKIHHQNDELEAYLEFIPAD